VRLLVRRLLAAVPLLLVFSFFAFALSRLTGESYFDRYKADKRFDPATVRELERRAGADRPFLVQYLRWLRGVLFDVRVERPRVQIAGFEEDDFGERCDLVNVGIAEVRSSAEDSAELRRCGVLALAAGGAEVRVDPRRALAAAGSTAPIFDPERYRAISISVRNPAPVVRRLEVAFVAGKARSVFLLDVEPGGWQRREMSVAKISADLGGREPERIHFSAPGSGLFRIDDLAAIEDRWRVSAGAPDFGLSLEHEVPVFLLLKERYANTLLLALSALVVTWTLAVPAGVLAAVVRGRWLDRSLSLLSFVGMSIPGFFLGLLLLFGLVSLSTSLGAEPFLPLRGAASLDAGDSGLAARIADRARHLVLPALVLSASSAAGLFRIARGNLLEVLHAPYVLAARAKGLPEGRVVGRHALRNAVNPLLSIFGTYFAALVSGAALVEIVFGYPGVGKLMLDAAISKDLPVVMASVITGGAFLVVGNLLADLALRAADPRIEDSEAGRGG
jgi:peptide/nickel transport system permease protein